MLHEKVFHPHFGNPKGFPGGKFDRVKWFIDWEILLLALGTVLCLLSVPYEGSPVGGTPCGCRELRHGAATLKGAVPGCPVHGLL